MSWQDHGTIFKVDHLTDWAVSHAYVPTAIELADRIRIFVAFWDAGNYGRLGYIDVDRDDPAQVLGYSETPVVPDAAWPAFDTSGITPLSILREPDNIRLYYAGWHVHDDPLIRYQLYTGLLVGDPAGASFTRFAPDPIIAGRRPDEHVRTGGQVLKGADGYRCYLASQCGTHQAGDKSRPIYNLECTTSADGVHWSDTQTVIFEHKEGEVLGFGRSAIWKTDQQTYEGLFSVRNWDGTYSDLMYSRSDDGLDWSELSRGGKAFLSSETCDGQTEVCFPSLIHRPDKIFMFYNGDDFGRAGLRLAIWQ